MRRRSTAIWLLAAGQTIAWAGLYYSFAALLPTWERSLGWSKTDLTFALTVAVVVWAVTAPLAGRIVDAGFGRLLLGFGAIGGALALIGLAGVRDQAGFIAVWAIIGLTQAACLYEACFAFVMRTAGNDARRAITRITLVAGFASPIAFPAGAYLAHAFGWRGAVIAFAAAVAVLAVPLLLVGAHWLETSGDEPGHAAPSGGGGPVLRAAVARPEFWLIATAFAMMALNHGMILNHIIPLLGERGMSEASAVAIASIIGPMQVAGRVAIMRYDNRVSPTEMTLVSFVGVFAAALVLLAAGGSLALAAAFAAMQGAAYGVTSILRPVVTADYLGRTGFGSVSGLVAVPSLAGFAVAPYAGALVWSAGGYNLMIIVAAAMAALGLACVAVLRWSRGAQIHLRLRQ